MEHSWLIGTAKNNGDAATLAPDESPPAIPMVRRITDGTPQQEAFWSELEAGNGHVLLEALAGTGKSSSCREGMHRLLGKSPRLAIQYCCFNKAIADEFRHGCPKGVDVGTMHSIGHRQCMKAFKSTLKTDKSYNLLDEVPKGKQLKRWLRKPVSGAVSLAKNSAIDPARPGLVSTIESLLYAFDHETYGQADDIAYFAAEVLKRSAEVTSVIDYDDMLWLPVRHSLDMPGCDMLFVDEAQDLNPIQHELVAKWSLGDARVVYVGDRNQAIYGFRGADSESLDTLAQVLDPVRMPLTVTFRCPKSHVAHANQIVPELEAHESAPEGIVESVTMKLDRLAADVVPGDLVLCRSNAPLVSACLKAISMRVPARMRGRAIGDAIIKVHTDVMRDSGKTLPGYARELDSWYTSQLARLQDRDGTEAAIEQAEDRYQCLLSLLSSVKDPADIPALVDELFREDDPAKIITFSSVHRAKGSEAERVHYIQIPYGQQRDRLRPPPAWVIRQRYNLRYVALTRSKDFLRLVTPA